MEIIYIFVGSHSAKKRVGITFVDADFKLGLVIVLCSDLLRTDLSVLRSVAI